MVRSSVSGAARCEPDELCQGEPAPAEPPVQRLQQAISTGVAFYILYLQANLLHGMGNTHTYKHTESMMYM